MIVGKFQNEDLALDYMSINYKDVEVDELKGREVTKILVKLGFNKGESTSGQLTDGFWFEISSDLKGEMYIWQEENGSFYVKYFFRASEGVKRRIESLHNLQNYFKRYGCEQLEIKLNNIHRVDPHLNSIFTQY